MTPRQAKDSAQPHETPPGDAEAAGIAEAAKALTDALGVLTRCVGREISDASLGKVAAALKGASADLAQASTKLSKANSKVMRARSGKAERTRSELLAAAARVFIAKGYEGASVADIAQQAGYTKGAFYANFASKEELILELSNLVIQSQLDMVERARESSASVFDVLYFTDAQCQDDVEHRDVLPTDEDFARQTLLGMEILTYAMRHPEMREQIGAGYQQVYEAVVQFQAQSQGRSVATQEDRQAVFGVTAIMSMSHIYERIMPVEEIRPMRDALIRRLLEP